MGPTASGKTATALRLVQQFPCSIISVDSAMVYRGLDIGTAKPTCDEQKIAPHRLIDICDPSEAYSAGKFCEDVNIHIQATLAENRIPLLIGGTMLYFHSFLNGLSPLPSANMAVREQLQQEADTLGWAVLHQRLHEIDPISAMRIHESDQQRIQRALEVFLLTKKPLSSWFSQQKQKKFPFEIIKIALMPTDRSRLHHLIEQRFDAMLADGFVNEVERLWQRKDLHADLPAIRTVGYRQAWDYLNGKSDYQTMRTQAITATRQLAKRQMTWLRSWPQVEICEDGEGVMRRVGEL
jgi:tRNA dimethylallyltransferase